MKNLRFLFLLLSLTACHGMLLSQDNDYVRYVDPRIGAEGVGRTFLGPSMPFGMVKPGPDCTVLPNAGWAPMPLPVTGFSQTHVSGTGGGQKYGNVLIQPFLYREQRTASGVQQQGYPDVRPSGANGIEQKRRDEHIALGYYATTFENGITTEITTAERCAFYRLHYPQPATGTESSVASGLSLCKGLLVDASHFLGKDSVPNLRERQQLVDAQIATCNGGELTGYTSVRGGWNNGDAYTVYFCLQADRPFTCALSHNRRWGVLTFSDSLVNVKIGISYVSIQQAKANIVAHDFNTQLQSLREAWQRQLCKVSLQATEKQKRMFYTALYHTMLMPVDKTGEYPRADKASQMVPYYDDYYAIWDTYRTSTPLLTLLDEHRQRDIVNSLLNIYKAEGYLPDARSGDCNGRTQGGSNAEVVIADAFVKGLGGIDYTLALEAMLKDATVPPADDEKEGRGGLAEYNRLGYIPYGIDRAGNRTIEYAYDDYCIAQVARGLGRQDLYERFLRQSANWKNLWRSDYSWDGMKGFIMPKDADGQWMDSVPWGRSKVFHPYIPYTPVTKVAPWYLPWWSTFFYEALSEEYSLSIPHDVEGLIAACGGPKKFRQRLDLFFDKHYYNIANEPSFLTPCYYHWIGRPDLSSRRIHQIVNEHYNDTPTGLPGNDDSGAMSSWLAFHMMGIYPNAGQPYYLLNVPMVEHCTMLLPNGRSLHITKKGQGDRFKKVLFNGRRLKKAMISHEQLLEGGELTFLTAQEKTSSTLQPTLVTKEKAVPADAKRVSMNDLRQIGAVSYTLNRQFRTWPVSMLWDGDTLQLVCKQTAYRIPRRQVARAAAFSWLNPQIDNTIHHDVRGTFLFISRQAFDQLDGEGWFVYDGITWRLQDIANGLMHVKADVDGTEMWIRQPSAADTVKPSWLSLPFVMEMRNNPLGIDWKLQLYEK